MAYRTRKSAPRRRSYGGRRAPVRRARRSVRVKSSGRRGGSRGATHTVRLVIEGAPHNAAARPLPGVGALPDNAVKGPKF